MGFDRPDAWPAFPYHTNLLASSIGWLGITYNFRAKLDYIGGVVLADCDQSAATQMFGACMFYPETTFLLLRSFSFSLMMISPACM